MKKCVLFTGGLECSFSIVILPYHAPSPVNFDWDGVYFFMLYVHPSVHIFKLQWHVSVPNIAIVFLYPCKCSCMWTAVKILNLTFFSLHAGIFMHTCNVCCHLLIFFKIKFSKKSFRNTIRISNSLDSE